jgi:hypothetical protein
MIITTVKLTCFCRCVSLLRLNRMPTICSFKSLLSSPSPFPSPTSVSGGCSPRINFPKTYREASNNILHTLFMFTYKYKISQFMSDFRFSQWRIIKQPSTMMWCCAAEYTCISTSHEPTASILRIEDRVSRFLQNADTLVPMYQTTWFQNPEDSFLVCSLIGNTE